MKEQQKKYLDYIPLIILVVSAVYLIVIVSTGPIVLMGRHYTGLAWVLLTGAAFFIRRLYGVLVLGFTLVLGLIGVLSLSPAIHTFSFGIGSTELVRFQPIFVLWLVIYFIVSGRYFTGILSKKYWQEVKEGKR